jgi:hypothetical protein
MSDTLVDLIGSISETESASIIVTSRYFDINC